MSDVKEKESSSSMSMVNENKVKYVRMQAKKDNLDFEDTTHQQRKNNRGQDSDSIPLFLGIAFSGQNAEFKSLLS